MSSLVTNLRSIIEVGDYYRAIEIIFILFYLQEVINRVTTADGCVHTADTTQLNSTVESRRRRMCVLSLRLHCLRGTSRNTHKKWPSQRERDDVFIFPAQRSRADLATNGPADIPQGAILHNHHLQFDILRELTLHTVWVKKYPPPEVFWHFPQHLGIFSPNFTRLLYIPIYTLDYKSIISVRKIP